MKKILSKIALVVAVLDGGPGRFYYRRPVTDHEKPKGFSPKAP